MSEPLNTPPVVEPAKNQTALILAILAIGSGVISLCGIFFWQVGILFSLLALVLGYFARKDPASRNLATIGMALGGAGILFVCSSLFFFRLLGPRVGNTFSAISSSLP